MIESPEVVFAKRLFIDDVIVLVKEGCKERKIPAVNTISLVCGFPPV